MKIAWRVQNDQGEESLERNSKRIKKEHNTLTQPQETTSTNTYTISQDENTPTQPTQPPTQDHTNINSTTTIT